MEHTRRDVHRCQSADAADAEDNFLLDTRFGASAVELAGDLTICRGVFLEIGVEQIERNPTDLGPPYFAEDRVLREVHANVYRRAVGILHWLDRQIVEIEFRIRFLLPAVGG